MIAVVAALGVTQIIGYGTLYYAFAILAPTMAREFATDPATLFAIFSAGLLLAGLAAPVLGRWMDRFGPPSVMMLGSLAVSLPLAGIGFAPDIYWLAGMVILQMTVSAAVLYEAAFATLAHLAGPSARRSITHLTLFGAVASTIFWPLTGWLSAEFGWRTAWIAFSLSHLGIAFPLHAWVWRRERRVSEAQVSAIVEPATRQAPLTGGDARFAFAAIAIGFAMSGTVVAALGVHMVLILQTLGLGAAAFAASMVMGPMQALIRLTDAIFFQRLHPLVVAILSGLAVPAAILILFNDASPILLGVLFAGLFGISQGLASIVKGSVPLVLFGPAGYAERLGHLAAIRAIPSAAAPFLFALLQSSTGTGPALTVLAGIGLLGVIPLVALHLKLHKMAAGSHIAD